MIICDFNKNNLKRNNMKNQTAVEWLIEQMFKQGYFDGNKPLTFTNLDHLQQQAKEMEKEQIIDAYDYGYIATHDSFGSQYFKEKFQNVQ